MRTSLRERICNADTLRAAWLDVATRHDGDEPPRHINRFARHADDNLSALEATLRDGSFQPHALHEVRIPKPDGTSRALRIPDVTDRIVERAILDVITPYIDPHLGHGAFAYRPGLGVQSAARAVAALRDEGCTWVLRGDIDECFPSIDEETAVCMLCGLLPDQSLDRLLAELATRPTRIDRRIRVTHGLPQGSSLSPIMANLVLRAFDDRVALAGFPIVRFADDFTIACATADSALDALDVAVHALSDLGLKMNGDKTEIMSFDDGFCFLGEDFGPKYPSADESMDEALSRVLYVARPGGRVGTSEGRITVHSKDDELLLSAPSSHVGRIAAFGSVGVTAGVRTWAMNNSIPVVFLSRSGNYQGQLLSAKAGTRVRRIRAQLATADSSDRCLRFARAVLATKIRHQCTLLKKLNRTDSSVVARRAVDRLNILSASAADAATMDEALGLEGAAAREYFACLVSMAPTDLGFIKRGERPAGDVVNACLNFGYALLAGECSGAIAATGLDPAIGFIHDDVGRRQSLALDLMEEFRPLIVDQVVFTLVRRGSITASDGNADAKAPEKGFRLSQRGKQVLLDAYERRMLQVTRGALPAFSGSMRRHLHRQAQCLAAFVKDPDYEWFGTAWR